MAVGRDVGSRGGSGRSIFCITLPRLAERAQDGQGDTSSCQRVKLIAKLVTKSVQDMLKESEANWLL